MTVENIVAGINIKLAGETLTYATVRYLLDEVIDDINTKLSAKFPDFDAISASGEYNFFPNQYIRSVLILGAAYKFYISDEEGTPTAIQYGYDYKDALFHMLRDYSERVPLEYQDRDNGYASGNGLTATSNPVLSEWWWD